jgi:hypothetical protein
MLESVEALNAMQQHSKHAPAAMDMHTTTEELRKVPFSTRSTPKLYNEYHRQVSQQMVISG